MADFKTINDLINEEIVTNGQGLIDAVLLRGILIGMLNAVGSNIDKKVDEENGKSLVLNTLITKLSNMPYITAYDYQNHLVTLSDDNGHSQVYQLTPYVPIADYYIGFAGGSSDDFRAMDKDDLLAAVVNSGGSLVNNHPTYSGTWNNYTMFVMLKSGVSVACTYVNQGIPQSLELNMTPPHDTVTIDGTTYTVVARRMANANIGQDTYTLNFTKN